MKSRVLLGLAASTLVALPLAFGAVGQGITSPNSSVSKPTVRLLEPDTSRREQLDKQAIDELDGVELRNAVSDLTSRVRDLEARVQALENPRVRVIPVQ
jgi:hypothetical protein